MKTRKCACAALNSEHPEVRSSILCGRLLFIAKLRAPPLHQRKLFSMSGCADTTGCAMITGRHGIFLLLRYVSHVRKAGWVALWGPPCSPHTHTFHPTAHLRHDAMTRAVPESKHEIDKSTDSQPIAQVAGVGLSSASTTQSILITSSSVDFFPDLRWAGVSPESGCRV